jgi:hypothetical protein
MNKKHVIGYAATAIVALGIGSASGTESQAGAAVGAAPTVTITAAAADSVAPAPTVTQTVEVPGPATTVTAGPPAAAAAIPGEGTYQVGVDVKPGTYLSKGPQDGNCYWARLSGSDGFADIIANGNTAGQIVVTIKKTDKFFETNGCNDWTKR